MGVERYEIFCDLDGYQYGGNNVPGDVQHALEFRAY
jgi:hypothetical protein